MEPFLIEVTAYISSALELVAAILIAIGAGEATVHTLVPWLKGKATQGLRRAAWLNFVRWILLGLEFTLAADIVRTASTPTWDAIGQLAAIAVIRTFLSYFLERDIEAGYGPEVRALDQEKL